MVENQMLYKIRQAQQQPVQKLEPHVNKGAGNKTIVQRTGLLDIVIDADGISDADNIIRSLLELQPCL